MRGSEFMELRAFELIARIGSFSEAAREIGMSRSALSQIIQNLEQRLGIRVLNRTTRSVTPTQAGLELLSRLGPALNDLLVAVQSIDRFRDSPAGTVRVLADPLGAALYLFPHIARFGEAYPGVVVDVSLAQDTRSFLAKGFDAAIAIHDHGDTELIAARLSDKLVQALVASPVYLAGAAEPQEPSELAEHRCIRTRPRTPSGAEEWILHRASETRSIRPEGPLLVDHEVSAVDAALAGFGVCLAPEVLVAMHIEHGRLTRILPEWNATASGHALYFPRHRYPAVAFTAFKDFIVSAARN